MHELSIIDQVVRTVLEDLKKRGVTSAEKIREVSLRVGALELHAEDSFRQAFHTLTQGTLLESSLLKLEIVPPQIECFICGHRGPYLDEHADHHDPMPCVACPKCKQMTPLSGGRGVDKISLTLDTVIA